MSQVVKYSGGVKVAAVRGELRDKVKILIERKQGCALSNMLALPEAN
jgi:hypothetical protein